jgi:hypothetical protein
MERHTALMEQFEQSGKPFDRDAFDPMMTYNGMAEDSSGPLHNTTVIQFIERNAVDGSNWELLTQVCLVMAYQYWEDDIRVRIAEAEGVERNKIVLPVMGELRHYRRAIIHNAGSAVPEMERNEILPAFQRGQKVLIDSQDYIEMMFALKRGVYEFAILASDA